MDQNYDIIHMDVLYPKIGGPQNHPKLDHFRMETYDLRALAWETSISLHIQCS
jgi:hypothetical protein